MNGRPIVAANKMSDPDFLRFRAKEVRATAHDLRTEEAKAIMMRVAEDYERIAKIAESIFSEYK